MKVGEYYWVKPNDLSCGESDEWQIAQVYADGVFDVFGWIPAPPGIPVNQFEVGPKIERPTP